MKLWRQSPRTDRYAPPADPHGPLCRGQGMSVLTAFMHRGLVVGAFRRMVGFSEMLAQRDPPHRFSAAEVL